jgi:hypothetical protein
MGVENGSKGDTIAADHVRNSSAQYDFSRNNDVLSRVSSSLASEDVPDAASEKDLVGAFFPLLTILVLRNRVGQINLFGYC